ncbi:NUDIX domain-containing protein [Polaribacter sp. WD7]|uniref:NUDIX hydrolase n=1 Tax=Polaribacter sp. WD7 TaxID=2269061 RepID=UPI000DF41059|nr:NUDIX domain-containing protein [Polaribacter sp. WD7]RCS27734.1 NUDIX domain-containing protein [Polaribacter sp. WD7]
MYKVFVNDTPIIITSSLKKEKNFTSYNFNNINFKEILHQTKQKKGIGICLHSGNLESDWISFTSNFEVVSAAGGLVVNAKKEYLFIFRNNVWDLPKGHLEKDETTETAAIREVEEECGISDLTLIKPLTTTYHSYYRNGLKLKQTYWFLMHSDYEGELKPQIEEGITQVNFKKESEIREILKNSYANIRLVYDTYKQG